MEIQENDNCSDEELINLQNTIENMEKTNQIKVLRILKKHTEVTINENKNGIHINLSELKKHIIDELINFIIYVNKQNIMLNHAEKIKEDYKNIFFDTTIEKNI